RAGRDEETFRPDSMRDDHRRDAGEKGGETAALRGRFGGAFSIAPAPNHRRQLLSQEAVMPDMKGTTRAQTIFLRAFRNNPKGPPPQVWPSPMVLRRWLKRPGFCDAMEKVLRALRYQADFQLTAAAASGATLLHEFVHDGDVSNFRKQL